MLSRRRTSHALAACPQIISINVVAAVPADKSLMVSLAQGAVAAAEAQKFETVAAGKAAAAKIEAKGAAEVCGLACWWRGVCTARDGGGGVCAASHSFFALRPSPFMPQA